MPTSNAPTRYTVAGSSVKQTALKRVRARSHGDGGLGGLCRPTSGPGWDPEGEVGLREEQQDGGGYGAKGKAVRPSITQAAHRIQRPAARIQCDL